MIQSIHKKTILLFNILLYLQSIIKFYLKNYIVIFLLLSLISPYMSVYSYFALKKYEIESNYAEKVQAGTISSELVALEFSREQSKNDLNWISKREFNFESACYRVIKVQYVGELIVYFCWKNIENTNLHRNLVDLIAGVIGHDNANRQFCIKFYFIFNRSVLKI